MTIVTELLFRPSVYCTASFFVLKVFPKYSSHNENHNHRVETSLLLTVSLCMDVSTSCFLSGFSKHSFTESCSSCNHSSNDWNSSAVNQWDKWTKLKTRFPLSHFLTIAMQKAVSQTFNNLKKAFLSLFLLLTNQLPCFRNAVFEMLTVIGQLFQGLRSSNAGHKIDFFQQSFSLLLLVQKLLTQVLQTENEIGYISKQCVYACLPVC